MLTSGEEPMRDWRQIAAEASKERDPEKLRKLTQELNQALEQRDEQQSHHRTEP